MALTINVLAASLALVGFVGYTLMYTVWLKRRTWQNIVWGGAAGAMPPLVGWAAVTGGLDGTAVYLFAIVFFWTPPHFWALSLLMKDDYARVGVPMLPVVRGEDETRRQILLYTILLYAVSQLPFCAGAFGGVYLALSVALGAAFIAGAVPPLVGWSAVTGGLDPAALYLFAIVFYWTPPHFWALALLKQKDYGKAGVPMAPLVWGEHETKRQPGQPFAATIIGISVVNSSSTTMRGFVRLT